MSNIEGWQLKILGAVADITMGQSPDSSDCSDTEIGLPFLQGCAEFSTKYPAVKQYCSRPKKIAAKGAVLFSVRAPVGKTNSADQEYAIGRGLAAFKATLISQDYLEYYLAFSERDFSLASQGSTFEAINSKELTNWSINFPVDEQEQTQIITILSTIDKAIEKTEAIIAKQQRIKTGLMQDLLTRGIDEAGNIRSEATHEFKDSPLGRIPVEWDVVRLGETITPSSSGKLQTGPFGSQLHSYEYVDEGIPVVMPQDITPEKISTLNIARITEEKAQELQRHIIKIGDILFARRGDLSRSVRITEREAGWICGTGCLLMRTPIGVISPWWVSTIYQFHTTQKQVNVNAVGSTMVNLNTTILSNLLIFLPELPEQYRIEQAMKEIQSAHQQSLFQYQKLIRIKSGLMQDLLTGKVRVTDLLTPSNN
jgi:type I restriction enzyme S subunit